jgi:ribonuclease P protein component
MDPRLPPARDIRLRKHADYQRVYQASRKHFSASMTYFFRLREDEGVTGPRVGLTAGRVLGKAVERNRIKRRMREAVRRHIGLLSSSVDVVLHPRRTVLAINFSELEAEIERVFIAIGKALNKVANRSLQT